jgi:hypothetical protein
MGCLRNIGGYCHFESEHRRRWKVREYTFPIPYAVAFAKDNKENLVCCCFLSGSCFFFTL